MNNKTVFLCWFFLSCMVPGLALGGQMRLIHVEMSYSGSAVSYNLYKDGVQVCVNNDPAATQMDCNVEIDVTPMTFVLTAVDAAGVESPQSAPYILIPPAIDPATGNFIPQANFTSTATSGMAPLPVSFDASSSSDLDGLLIAYAWDFGDGSTGAGKLIDYTFAAVGTYTVTLTVVDDRGASAVKTTTVTVSDQPPAPNTPPVAVLNATSLLAGTSQIGFDAYKSSDTDGTIVSYAWNFGDGDTAVGNYIEHEFRAAGDYTVVLTVTDDKGASSQDQMIMTVVDTPKAANLLPVAVISASSEKRLVHFAWDYTGADPGLAGFRLYQNSRMVCEVANPLARETDCLTYVDNGAVQLWVTSYDQAGTESSASSAMRFDSTGMFPAAGGGAPLVVHFTSGASSDPDGTITSYAWNFGDGATGEGLAADHVFTVPGVYTVTLTVVDNSGAQSLATTIITVADTNPPIATNASFSTVQEKSVTGTLSANDPDGSPLSFKIAKDGSLGTATITNAATGVFTYVPKVGSFGADAFTFKANDGTFDSNEAVVSITIEKTNLAPTAKDQALAAQEDSPVSGALTATDANNDPMTFSLVTPPAHGLAVLSDAKTGAFQYTPEANYHGPDSFTFKANDGQLDSVVASVQITITPVNDAPLANPDSAQVESGKQVTLAVLGNDTDTDNDSLTIATVTIPAHGQAAIVNGEISYTANFDFSGSDSFSYTISDGVGGTASAEVAITVLPPLAGATPKESITYTWEYDATVPGLSGFKLYMNGEFLCETSNPADRSLTCLAPITSGVKTFYLQAIAANAIVTNPSNTITFDPNAPVAPPVPVNVAPTATNQTLTLAEDASLDGTLSAADTNNDPLTFSLITAPAHGVATVAASGAFTYTPTANFNGTDSFTFKANDGQVASAPGSVSLTITPVNDAPTAAAVSLSVIEDATAFGQVSASDLDGDSLSYSIITNGSKGVAVISNASSGEFSYTPKNNENGQDSFVCRVSDGKLTADVTATVTITPVNDAPVATAGKLMTEEDIVGAGQLTASDLDGDSLTFSIVSSGSKGEAVISNPSTGMFAYTPKSNENGQDTFVYKVSDGTLTAEASVLVTITPVNDAPIATDGTLTTAEDTTGAGKLTVSDIDGDSLSYSIITNGSKGAAGISNASSGEFSYTPKNNENGLDSFVCRVSDGKLTADVTVTVTITPVNDAPVATAGKLMTEEDIVGAGQLTASDLDGDSLTFSIVSNGSKGEAVISNPSTGMFAYTPKSNENGQDTFVYKVSDGTLTAEASVTVNITPVNDAPTATAGTLTTAEDTTGAGQLTASDPEGDSLSYSIIANGNKGVATITNASTGTFTYTPAKNENGQDGFTYRVSDGKLNTDATVVVGITAVNDAPLAANDTLATNEDTLVSGQLLGSDLDGDRLSYSIITDGSKGKATIVDSAVGLFTYTPAANQNGQDTIVYQVSDSTLTAKATVTVTIAPVNDAPVAVNAILSATEDTLASGQVAASDPDGDRLSYSIITNGSKGTAKISDAATGAFTYTPSTNQNGQDIIVFRASDGSLTAEVMVTVTIAPVNDAPHAVAISVWAAEDVVASGQLPGSDVDGDRLSYSIVNAASKGSVILTDITTGAFTYTPSKNVNGQDTFTYRVSDGTLSADATVTATIEPVNDAPVANADTVQVESGSQVLVDAIANDVDVDGDTVSVLALTAPAHGKAVIAEGKISYTANIDFIGTDSFSYTINDGAGGTATGAVAVTVLIPMQAITYTWDYPVTASDLAGFKLYMNEVLVGETANPAARTLTVKVPKSGGEKSFHLAAIGANATESTSSNILKFSPAVAPEVIPTQSVTYTWDYSATVTDLAGFKLYMNGSVLCETSNATARTLTCEVPKSTGAKSFYVTAIGANAVETTPSNSLNFVQ